LFSNIEWVNGDLLDIYSLYDSLEGVTQVYHCAAVVSFDKADKNQIMKTNVGGTTNLVNAALDKNIEKLCYVSSIAAIGKPENGDFISEKFFWKFSKNHSVYSMSKYDAEREVWRGIAEGLNAVIINPSIILGPGNWNSGSSRLITSVWDGLKFYTKGVNGYVDVRDVAKTMILLMNSEINSERYIVSSENIDYQTLFNYIAAGLNKTPPKYKAAKFLSELVWRADKIKTSILKTKPLITKETARTANAKSYYSNEKIISAINYKFIPVAQSIEHICKLFIQDNP
jgi:nucleoside-diphosphate-sugar epimerase